MKNVARFIGSIVLMAVVSAVMFQIMWSTPVGTTLTTISSTDNLSDFPTTYNNNLSAVNSGKLEASDYFSTTTHQTITSLPNLVTVGALNSGSLASGFTDIPVAVGGTASSAPTGILYGDGGGALVTIPFGTSGQFLQSNGAGAMPTFETSSIDQGAEYNWTGFHTFTSALFASTTITAATTTNATTTNASITNLLDIQGALSFSNETSSSTVPTIDGSGNVTFNDKMRLLARNELTGAAGSISVTGEVGTSTQYLTVRFFLDSASGNNLPQLTFNGNTNSKYVWVYGRDDDTGTKNSSGGLDTAVDIIGNDNRYVWGTMDVQNYPDSFKLLEWDGGIWDGETSNQFFQGNGIYTASTTEAIERIDITAGGVGANFQAGSWLEVWGM